MCYRHILILLLLLSLVEARGQKYRYYANPEYTEQLKKLGIQPIKPSDVNVGVTASNPLRLLFHIVYQKDNKPTIDEKAIVNQIASLNQDFNNATFERSAFTKDRYAHLAIDTGIQFCSEFRVNYVPSDSAYFEGLMSVKFAKTGGAEAISPERFINIWVCDLQSNELLSITNNEFVGYAQMPGYPLATDGIVIDKDFFGTKTSQSSPYAQGKTLTHLMGNYLGLQDLWGLKNCADDGIQDTPLHSGPSLFVGETISLCYRYLVFQMTINFMDNTPDTALCMFTKGQKEKMWTELKTRRSHLLTNPQDCK